jgi:ribosomal protein L12E/L44/L45/RPP1/RPP2
VTTADQSPSGGDRSAAMSLIDAAVKSGRIVQADRDMRADQIKNATTKQDIDIVVRDLQVPVAAVAGAAAAPTAAAGTPGQPPWPLVNYGPHQGQSAEVSTLVGNAGKKIGGIIAVVVLISVVVPIVGVIIGLVTARDTFDDISFGEPVDETTYLPGQEPGENGVNVHTVSGYDDMVLALTDEVGSTRVFSATIYPRYAVLDVPEKETGKRYGSYYWDGRTLDKNDFKSTTDAPRIDLESVDVEVMLALLDDVRGRIEDPTSWYVNISAVPTDGPRLAVYASNEYGEGAYILATLQGEITYESTYGG